MELEAALKKLAREALDRKNQRGQARLYIVVLFPSSILRTETLLQIASIRVYKKIERQE